MLVGFLLFAMYGGGAFFAKWDMMDKNALLYLKGLDGEEEEDDEKNSNKVDIKAFFSPKSVKRIALNFHSQTAMEASLQESLADREYTADEYEPETHEDAVHAEIVKHR